VKGKLNQNSSKRKPVYWERAGATEGNKAEKGQRTRVKKKETGGLLGHELWVGKKRKKGRESNNPGWPQYKNVAKKRDVLTLGKEKGKYRPAWEKHDGGWGGQGGLSLQ